MNTTTFWSELVATPEHKVKDRVRKILSKYLDGYKFMPATHGYGSSGVPDIVACVEGKFLAVECKANGNKPTALQKKNLDSIVKAGGYAFVVDDQSIGVFILTLDNVVNGKVAPYVFDFTDEEEPR
jgi:Holliday junction resolvase